MDRRVPAAHASHDELLIARLYGGDVDEVERTQALDRVADCPECTALLADLGAIAAATADMSVPARPRDFTLTQADAARLRRQPRGWSAMFGRGLRRSLGSSLAALGLVGVVLTGAASLVGGTASMNSAPFAGARAPAPVAVAAGSAGTDVSAYGSSPIADASTASAEFAAPPSTSPAAASSGHDGGTGVPRPSAAPAATAAPTATVPAATAAPTATAPVAQWGVVSAPSVASAGGVGTGQAKSVPGEEVSQNGIDSRLVWLGGFGALFAIGLAMALLPRLPRGRGRGRSSRS